jgi:hypothetical protein
VFHRAERLDVRQGPVQEHGLRGGEGRLGQRRGRLKRQGTIESSLEMFTREEGR